MINKATISKFEPYIGDETYFLDLPDVAKSISEITNFKDVHCIINLINTPSYISLQITENLEGRGELKEVKLWFEYYIKTDELMFSFPDDMSTSFVDSLIGKYSLIMENEIPIEEIFKNSVPYINQMIERQKICQRLKFNNAFCEDMLAEFGPIESQKELKTVLAKLWKTPKDEWPTSIQNIWDSKSEGRKRVITRFNGIPELLKQIDDYEYKYNSVK